MNKQVPATATTTNHDPWRWTRWLPLATALALAVAAVLLRTCEVGAEADYYHERAEQLLAGKVVYDRFHPFGYIVLTAAVHTLVASSLLAGCFVSAAAAGLLVASTGALAAALRPGAGGPARVLAASNAIVWVYGTMASSDLTAAAVATTAVALLLAARGEPSGRRSLAIGLLLGFAVACRFATGIVVLAVALGTLAASRRWRTALVLATGLAIGYLPHAVPGSLATGSPFQNDNWHILVLKVVCNLDLEHLQRLYDTHTMPTLMGFLRTHLGVVVARGLDDTGTALADVLPAMLAGAGTAVPGLRVWPLLLALAGLCLCAQRRRAAFLVAGLVGLTTLAVCTTFAPHPRALLGVLPFLIAGLAIGATAIGNRRQWWWVPFGALWLLATGHGMRRYGDYLGEQPEREVAVMRQLPQLVARPFVLLTTNAHGRRYVRTAAYGYQALPFATADETWNAVRQRLHGCGADVFLAGRLTNPSVHRHLVASEVPGDFRRRIADDDVVLVERILVPTDWIADLGATPPVVRAGATVQLALRLSPLATSTAIVAAGALLRAPGGEQQVLDFLRLDDRTHARPFVAPDNPGVWLAEPFLLRNDGQFLRGKVCSFVVEKP